jgi:polysaccharide pyruvyl transferase CsaB
MSHRTFGLFGYYGNANTGDEAILRVITEQLRIRDYGDELVVFSSDPATTRSWHGVDAVAAVLPKSPRDWVVGSLGRSRSSFFATIRAERSLRTALFGGGGLIFDRPEGNPWLLGNLDQLERWVERGVRTAVFAVGVGPLTRSDSRARVGEVLRKVDLVTVRDDESAALLVECGVPGETVHVGADLVWALEPSPGEPERRSERPGIAVCLRGEHAVQPTYIEAWSRALQTVLRESDADLWFLPMQTGGGCDDRIGQRLVADTLQPAERVHCVEDALDPAQWAGWMRGCDLVFAERLHGAVLSMLAGVPAVGRAYMPKVSRVFREVGKVDWLVEGEDLSAASLVEAFHRAWNEREAGTAHLLRVLPGLKIRALSHFDRLQTMLESKR